MATESDDFKKKGKMKTIPNSKEIYDQDTGGEEQAIFSRETLWNYLSSQL